MNHLLLPAGSGTASQIFLNGVLLVVGSIICAVAVNGILIPQNFLSSGFTGASLIIHYLVPSLSVGVIYLLLNIPVFIAGWSMVGKRFFFYSVAGTVIYSLALTVVRIDISIENKILSALLHNRIREG